MTRVKQIMHDTLQGGIIVINFHPIKLSNGWKEGFALDLHTLSSEFLGYNEFGHEIYDTKRSEIGELLYRLKSKSDKSVIKEIVDVVQYFLCHKWSVDKLIDLIVPVPPSRTGRTFQPVMEIAEEVGRRLKVPVETRALIKTKKTPELKGIREYDKRVEALKDAFSVEASITMQRNILLLDDLYRSGATLNVITRILYGTGSAKSVYILALTRTRVNR